MDLREYQLKISEHAVTRPNEDLQLAVDMLSLCGAAHWVSQVVNLRDDGAFLDYLGDTLYYTARVLSSFELRMGDYAPLAPYSGTGTASALTPQEYADHLLKTVLGLSGHVADHLGISQTLNHEEMGKSFVTLMLIVDALAHQYGYTIGQVAHRSLANLQ